MGTTKSQQPTTPAVSSTRGYEPDTVYPALPTNPSGNPVEPVDPQADLRLADPMRYHVTEQVGPNMTRTYDTGPSLPFRGPLQHGAGTTISSTADQMQRQLDNDLKDALPRADGRPEQDIALGRLLRR